TTSTPAAAPWSLVYLTKTCLRRDDASTGNARGRFAGEFMGGTGEATPRARARPSAGRMTSVSLRRTIGRMDAVALAATLGGSVVALAGVGATAWGIKQQRESAKELDASRQTHERLLASGARLFEKRSSVYEQMVGMLRRWREEVAGTEPS